MKPLTNASNANDRSVPEHSRHLPPNIPSTELFAAGNSRNAGHPETRSTASPSFNSQTAGFQRAFAAAVQAGFSRPQSGNPSSPALRAVQSNRFINANQQQQARQGEVQNQNTAALPNRTVFITQRGGAEIGIIALSPSSARFSLGVISPNYRPTSPLADPEIRVAQTRAVVSRVTLPNPQVIQGMTNEQGQNAQTRNTQTTEAQDVRRAQARYIATSRATEGLVPVIYHGRPGRYSNERGGRDAPQL